MNFLVTPIVQNMIQFQSKTKGLAKKRMHSSRGNAQTNRFFFSKQPEHEQDISQFKNVYLFFQDFLQSFFSAYQREDTY